ncbi:MAG: V-type ATP synthase subunit D [Methanocellales archaeon]|nr:V-type ATP synthase subunit D [Methanocellales archaeon]MDD3292219.1 V-type ATP synthase subunit D [Methanocellales archaeon]MDD5234795.1 V-type ATP synthase subunit D [Methanocellales archaeon]MDD5484835.1 V-type ATP synthase subunit D [Methanocellales archaeon]
MINVKATRMELLNIKKRIKIAKRGHKLLKDKRDGLMKQFLSIVNESMETRRRVDSKLNMAHRSFLLTRAMMSVEEIEGAIFYPKKESLLAISYQNIMGVNVPKIKTQIEKERNSAYSLVSTTSELDHSLELFDEALVDMIRLAEIQKSVELLALEIGKTRRRVNALEHVLIPQLEDAARYISMKLDEMERSNFCNLMRIKEIMEV